MIVDLKRNVLRLFVLTIESRLFESANMSKLVPQTIVIGVLVAWNVLPAVAQPAPDGSPSSPSFAQPAPDGTTYRETPATEDLLRQRISNLVKAECQRWGIPGYALAVVKDERIFYQAGFGLADIEARRPVTPETVFGLASVTKTFTALALLDLVDRGLIDLDQTVGTYLPDVRPKWKRLTIRQLASMTAGMRKGIPRECAWVEEMRILERLPLLSEPGSNFAYSNPSYRLLGTIIERVTGKPYLQVIRDLITTPLSMPMTGIPETLSQTGLLSAAYSDENGNGPLRKIVYKPTATSYSAGMLFSNVIDMSRYAGALMNRMIISPQGYQTLWFDRPPLPSGAPSNWAFGWGSAIDKRYGQRRIGMNGGDPAVSSTVLIFPESGIAVIGLSNLHKPPVYRIARMVARIVLGLEQDGAGDEPLEGEGLPPSDINQAQEYP